MKIILSHEQIGEAIARYVRSAGVTEGSNLTINYELAVAPDGNHSLRALVEPNDEPSRQIIDYLMAPKL